MHCIWFIAPCIFATSESVADSVIVTQYLTVFVYFYDANFKELLQKMHHTIVLGCI